MREVILKFDSFNKLLVAPKFFWSGDRFSLLGRKKFLLWNENSYNNAIKLITNYDTYEHFDINLFTTYLLQDLQLFRDELFKDCLVVGKFSFVQLDEIKKWRVELCSKPVPRVDITYNNGEIQVIRSYISPEEYRDKVCLKYMF